jgi:hypothetical protein
LGNGEDRAVIDHDVKVDDELKVEKDGEGNNARADATDVSIWSEDRAPIKWQPAIYGCSERYANIHRQLMPENNLRIQELCEEPIAIFTLNIRIYRYLDRIWLFDS